MDSYSAVETSTICINDQKAPLTSEELSLLGHIFQANDPLITQSLLSFSFQDEHWKLNAWKEVLLVLTQHLGHFNFSLRQLQNLIDSALRQLGMIYVTPTETLMDIAQALCDLRHILRRDIVLKYIGAAWDAQFRKQYFQRILSEPLPLLQIPPMNVSSSSFFSQLFDTVSSSISSVSLGLLRVPTARSSMQANHECVSLHVERHLPYTEAETYKSWGLDVEMLHLKTLQTWANQFFDYIKQKQHENFATHPSPLSQPLNSTPMQSSVFPLSFVSSYLKTQVKGTVTNEDVYIFVWYLAFFVTSCDCQPFVNEFEECFGNGNLLSIQGIKIVWDGCRLLGTTKDDAFELTPQDRIQLLEIYAIDVLRQRLVHFEALVVHAEEECKKALKTEKRSGALVWLKKKKFFERQIHDIEVQLMRLEEARQYRDASRTMGFVASALKSSSASLKISLEETGRLATDAVSDMKESQIEMQKAQNLFQETLDEVTDGSLEEEYNNMLLESLPEVPQKIPSKPFLMKEYNISKFDNALES